MRTSISFACSSFVVALALAGCGGGGATTAPATASTQATSAATGPLAILSFAKAPESGTVDKVGTVDGNFTPDQTPDLVFDITVQGPVKALFVVTVDKQGAPNKKYRADTLVKDQEAPEELGGMLEQGSFSGGIGVYENGKIVNDGDGSLDAVRPGTHTFKIFVNRVESLGTGGHVRAYVTGPDGKPVASPVVEY